MASRQTGDNYIRQLINYSALVPERFKKTPEYILMNERNPICSIVVKIWRSKNFNTQPMYLTLSPDETTQYRKSAGIVLTYQDYTV
jgi:hypothetical protein